MRYRAGSRTEVGIGFAIADDPLRLRRGLGGRETGLISAKGLLGLEEKCLPQSQCVLLAAARENDPYAKLPKMQFAKEQVVLHA